MRKRNVKRTIRLSVSYIILAFAAICSLFPLGWIISTSFKPANEIYANPPVWIPKNPTIQSFIDVIETSSIPRAFLNSLIIGLSTTAIALILGGLAGYAFSRFKFKGNQTLSLAFLTSQMLPITVLMIPMYYLLGDLNLIDNKFGVVMAHMVICLPMVIWMTKGYFNGIPKEFEEAATIDGCTPMQTLWHIVLPLLKPSIAATGVYAFICSWNEFAFANVLTMTEKSQTLPLSLTEFSTFFKVDWGDTMAAATLTTVPVVIIFMLVQKNFVEGLASGGVKE